MLVFLVGIVSKSERFLGAHWQKHTMDDSGSGVGVFWGGKSILNMMPKVKNIYSSLKIKGVRLYRVLQRNIFYKRSATRVPARHKWTHEVSLWFDTSVFSAPHPKLADVASVTGGNETRNAIVRRPSRIAVDQQGYSRTRICIQSNW